MTYVKEALPDVLKRVGLDEDQLKAIVTSKIVKAEIARLAPAAAAVESPAMERAAGNKTGGR